jgi:hypothetical protein
MARMFPESLEPAEKAGNGPTPGEVEVFRFLRDAVKPDAEYEAFYEAAVGRGGQRKWPDFVLFGRYVGLIVIEVKDWRAGQIVKFDKGHVLLADGSESESRNNPERQAKSYADAIVSALQRHGVVASRKSHDGPALVPVGRLIAFPYISHEEYLGRGFEAVLPIESALLKEDLDPSSDRYLGGMDADMKMRFERLQKFPCPALTSYDVTRIRNVIWPEARVALPTRLGTGKEHFQQQVKYLDGYQARVARALARGHQIVKGPPGSGKTLVLAHRCKFLSQLDPGIKNVLFVCYNIALASYIKRLVQEQGLGVGPGAVRVHHFYDLCSTVLGEKVDYEGEDADYYAIIVGECLNRIAQSCAQVGPFDAALVDEGQDFDAEMFRVLRGLLRDDRDLVIAIDSEQNLYHKQARLDRTWKSLGIEVQGHVTRLTQVYRSTREIVEFSHRLIAREPPPPRVEESEDQLPLPGLAEFRGDPPLLVECSDSEQVGEFLVRDISRCVASEEYKRSEIAVIYDDKQYGKTDAPSGFAYGSRSPAEQLKARLELAGIPVEWVSESVYAKKSFDITTDRVSLLSVHSAKGIDFDLVYLVEPGRELPGKPIPDERLGSVYVAVTRAKHRLQIVCVRGDPFIPAMVKAGAQETRPFGQ